MSQLTKSFLECHLSHITALFKMSKKCVYSLKSLGITLRMDTKELL